MKELQRKIRVLIADDHGFIRKAVASYIALLGDKFEVSGEVEDGELTIKTLKEDQPNILILDLEMPNKSGFEVLKYIKKQNLTVKTIVLSAHYNEFMFKELIHLGAASYLPKNCNGENFCKAVNSVVKEGFYITPEVSKDVVVDLIKENKVKFFLTENVLSEREIEIIDLMCEGLLYKEIAEKLFISINTVKFHMKSIYKKTSTTSNAALIKYAVKVGIIGVEPNFRLNQ